MTIFGNTSTDMNSEGEHIIKQEETEAASERVNSDAEDFEAEFETATESEGADEPVMVVEVEDDDLLWVNSADVKAYARLTAPDEVEEIFYKGQDLLARIKDLEAKNALLMRENKEVVLDSERLEDKVEQMKHDHSMLEAELESQRDFAAEMYCKEEGTTLMQHLDAALEAGDLFKYHVMFSDGMIRSATRGIDPEELEQAMVSVRRSLFDDEELN